MTSFSIGLTGLNAASKDLEVTGHNVANASTAGFKNSRAEFADVFALSYTGLAKTATGSGVNLAAVAQQFTQGDLDFTDNNLDLAINGEGFFVVERDGTREFTRAGQFQVDKDGFIVNSAGQRLQGYPPDGGNQIDDIQLTTGDAAPRPTGEISALMNLSADAPSFGFNENIDLEGLDAQQMVERLNQVAGIRAAYDLDADTGDVTVTVTNETEWDIEDFGLPGGVVAPNDFADGQIPAGRSISFTLDEGTTWGEDESLAFQADTPEIDPNDPDTYNESTSLTVYDSLGAERTVSLVLQRQPPPSDKEWAVKAFMDGAEVGEGRLNFNNDGTLNQVDSEDLQINAVGLVNGAADLDIDVDFGQTTQYGGQFSVSDLKQDGYATGRLIGVDVGDDGTVFARFTNGANRSLGQVALANFPNAQGLQPVGGTNWVESFDSGQALIGRAGQSSFGLIQGGAFESSNVNIAEQLVNLITAQRNFQANAQVISTADTITQTIINIR